MEFSKYYNSLPNKLVVDPSLINITDSASEINIISNKVDVISDGSNNIAELNLVGKYQGDNNNLGNAKLHIGAFKDTGSGTSNLVGGGICFFSEINDTGFVNSTVDDITDNNLCFYRSDGGDNEAVFYYQATTLGNNGIIYYNELLLAYRFSIRKCVEFGKLAEPYTCRREN